MMSEDAKDGTLVDEKGEDKANDIEEEKKEVTYETADKIEKA
jgi:hypothetical protein